MRHKMFSGISLVAVLALTACGADAASKDSVINTDTEEQVGATIDTNEESFYALVVLDGSGSISAGKDSMELMKGDCVFIPRRSDKVKVKGSLELLTARI